MLWQNIQRGLMFVVALVTCPCHIPLFLPLALVLLAGTPAATWLTQNVNWVYGGMTILFLFSLTLGFRWMGHNTTRDCESCSAHPIKKSEIQAIPEGVRE